MPNKFDFVYIYTTNLFTKTYKSVKKYRIGF